MTNFRFILGILACMNILLQVTGTLESAFQMNPMGITWENATKMCDEHGLEYDNKTILENITSIQDGVEFWIGVAVYRVLTPWIEILGCFEVSEDKVCIFSSIVLCKRHCRTDTFIGYKKSTKQCVCLGNSHNGKGRKKPLDCEKPEKKTEILIYIYKELGEGLIMADSSNTGNCITLCCEDCTGREEKEPTNCSLKDQIIETRCESENDPLHTGQSYQTSMKACIDEKNKLLQPSDLCRTKDKYPGSVMWSNVFRDEIEEQMTQSDGHNFSPVRCLTGIIYEHEGDRKLNISERDCNTTVEGFVCKHYSSTTEKVSTSTTLHPYTTNVTTTHDFNEAITGSNYTSEVLISSALQTEVTDDTTTHDFTEAQTDSISTFAVQSSTSNSNTADQMTVGRVSVGIVAGITVTVIGFLIALAVLVVCRLRSAGIFKNTIRKHEGLSSKESEGRQIPNEIENVKRTDSNTYDLVADGFLYNYVEIEKKTNADVPIITSDDTYVESSYGEYDRLNVTNKRKVNSDENTYEGNAGVRNMVDPTYDTSKFNDPKDRESNVYDHSYTGGSSDYGYGYAGSHMLNIDEGMYDK